MLDTTTSVLVAASTNCTECTWPEVMVYNMSASTSLNDTGESVEMIVPTANFTGLIVRD